MAHWTSWRRSLPFQGGETGSKPVCATKIKETVMVEKLNLSKEEIAKIEEIVKNPPPVTDYVRRYIEAYRKKCAGSSVVEQTADNR